MVAEPYGAANPTLAHVAEGMEVHDRYGEKVGKVKQIYLGGEDLAESAVAGDSVLRDAPEALRGRLAASGFVEIGTGILQRNLYAIGEQVSAVREDGVWLSADKGQLVKK